MEQHANQVEATDQPGTAENQVRSHPPRVIDIGRLVLFPDQTREPGRRRGENSIHPAREQEYIPWPALRACGHVCECVRVCAIERRQTWLRQHMSSGVTFVPDCRATAPCQSRFPNAQICTVCMRRPSIQRPSPIWCYPDARSPARGWAGTCVLCVVLTRSDAGIASIYARVVMTVESTGAEGHGNDVKYQTLRR